MTFKQQMYLVRKSGTFKLLLMGLIYGFLFGGISKIIAGLSLSNDSLSFYSIVRAVFMTTINYNIFFILIIAIVEVTMTIRVFQSIGLARENIVKHWTFFYGISMGCIFIMSCIYMIFLKFENIESLYPSQRILGVNMEYLPMSGSLKLIIYALIALSLVFLISSSIGIISNNYGWKYVVATCITCFTMLLLLIRPGVDLIFYGKGIVFYSLLGLVLNIVLLLFVRRGLLKMEVKS